MADMADRPDVYLESGKKRVFAGAIEWPGWARSGRTEEVAFQEFVAYGPRYAAVLAGSGLAFEAPAGPDDLNVVQRLQGGSTTDFGAIEAAPAADARPLDGPELERLQRLLQACWDAFDAAADAAAGKELRKGPRGGGRELDGIMEHVLGADRSYLGKIGWKLKLPPDADPPKALELTRAAILDGLAAAARGELPTQGPRGGAYWTPRYFVRRVAWHVLDHAWEIEDRIR